MDPERKLAMFDLLVSLGYKEIEVGFPVASKDDYDFVRLLIDGDHVPEDVDISVLVPARDELIRRTAASLAGARRATIHLYNATSPLFRRVVFAMTRDECKNLATDGTRLMMKYAAELMPQCRVSFEYSPEIFNETELDFALEVCESVMDVWETGPGREIILNFPATVERAMPNIFADQIEWLDRHLSRREFVCLSIHPHNDRGTGIAAAELALLAGAQRVEGCLLGSGERAGNVDLVTLGLNLYTQGIDPGIDFSDLPKIRRVVESCLEMPIHPRHPYAGDLIYTALSGSHQDAIKKGFDAMDSDARAVGKVPAELPWGVPYLPIDPLDVGRNYSAVVRISSQSGKGGVAYVMSTWHGLELPAGLRADFAQVVQAAAEADGGELTPSVISELFDNHYFSSEESIARAESAGQIDCRPVRLAAVRLYLSGSPGDWAASVPLRSLRSRLGALGTDVTVVAHPAAGDRPVVYAECLIDGVVVWGAARDRTPEGDLGAVATAAIDSALARAGTSAASGMPAA